MSGTRDKGQDMLDTIRKWTRDLLIIAAVIIFIVHPAFVSNFLQETGLELTYDSASKTWGLHSRAITLATQISTLVSQVQTLQAEVNKAANEKGDATLSDLSQAIENVVAQLNTVSGLAAASVAAQQSAPFRSQGRAASPADDGVSSRPVRRILLMSG